MNAKTLRKVQIFWCLFIGIGAYFGAAMMLISPQGTIMGMDGMLPYFQKLPFADRFFTDFFWPGIALMLVNGVTNTIAAVMLLRRNKYGGIASMICGIILMLWIGVQFYIFPINFMSTIFFIFGLSQAAGGYILSRQERKLTENK